MELHKLTILVVLLTTLGSVDATIAGLTYKDSIEQGYPPHAPEKDVCHPLYWYPRPIPVFCETIQATTQRPLIKSTTYPSPTTPTPPAPTSDPSLPVTECPPCPSNNDTSTNDTCKPCPFIYPQFFIVPPPIIAIPFIMSSSPVLPPVFPGPPMVPIMRSVILRPFPFPFPPPFPPPFSAPLLPPVPYPSASPPPPLQVVYRPVLNLLDLKGTNICVEPIKCQERLYSLP